MYFRSDLIGCLRENQNKENEIRSAISYKKFEKNPRFYVK